MGDRERVLQKQARTEGVTEIVEMANRGHSLTIDNGWREVCDTALAFVQRFTSCDAGRSADDLQPAGV